MADIKPIKGVYNTGNSIGLAEFIATDTVGIVDGGTGGTTAPEAKTNLSLENVDNTSDANKPVSTAQQTALDTKVDDTDLADNVFAVYDNIDNTKKIAFEASGIATATTRTITMPNAEIDLADVHTHTNKAVLDATTASFLTADESKLDGIEAGAQADQIAAEVANTPAGTITATDVQAALNELDTEKLADVVGDTTPQLGGNLDCNGNQITDSSYLQAADATPATTTTHTFDYSAGDMQQITAPAAGTLTIAFSNFVASNVCAYIFDIVNGGNCTITWPAAMLFAGGVAPTLTVAGTDRLLVTKDKDDVYTLTVVGTDIKTV